MDMKKAAKISMGVAGAAAAACIVAGVASGNGFKDVSMVSVSGIMAEAQTTEAASAVIQDVTGSQLGLTVGAEAQGSVQEQADGGSVDGLISGADSVDETEAAVDTEAGGDVSVTYTSETVYVPAVAGDDVSNVKEVSVKADKPVASESKSVSKDKKASAKKTGRITTAEAKHVHEWQPVFESVHHVPVTHIEKQFVKTGYEISRSEEYFYNGKQFNYYNYSKTEIDKVGDEKIVDLNYGFFINRIEVSEEEYNTALQALRDEAEAKGDSDAIEASAMSSIAPVGHEVDVEVVDKEAYDEDVVVGYRCSCGDKKDIAVQESSDKESEEKAEVVSENIKEDVECADDIEEDIEDECIEDDCKDKAGEFEKIGCASRALLLYTEDDELVGSVHECNVCGTQEVYDTDYNEVYSACDVEDFLSNEEAIELLTK